VKRRVLTAGSEYATKISVRNLAQTGRTSRPEKRSRQNLQGRRRWAFDVRQRGDGVSKREGDGLGIEEMWEKTVEKKTRPFIHFMTKGGRINI